LKVDWLEKSINNSKDLGEETLLSIIEQISEHGQYDEDVTEEVRSVLISNGVSGDKTDNMVKRAHLRAEASVTHKIVIPEGTYNATTMAFFINLEIKRNCRYNSPFSTILISYDKIVDLRTFAIIDLSQDNNIQLTNQSLNILKDLKRDLDHTLTQSVGCGDPPYPDFSILEVKQGDLILICSDGLTDMIGDSEIETILSDTEASLNTLTQHLIDAANDKGGKDNISVILVSSI